MGSHPLPRAGPPGSGLFRGPRVCKHAWGPLPPGKPPCSEPVESPSKWKLVEELRRMRRQGGPWKGGEEGIRVQTGAQPSPHMNPSTLSGWGLHSEHWEPWFQSQLCLRPAVWPQLDSILLWASVSSFRRRQSLGQLFVSIPFLCGDTAWVGFGASQLSGPHPVPLPSLGTLQLDWRA